MKEELSKIEVIRWIWNGFDVCLKYRVDLGIKIWKNVTKTHILGPSGNMYRYTLNMYRYTLGSGHFWPMCIGTC